MAVSIETRVESFFRLGLLDGQNPWIFGWMDALPANLCPCQLSFRAFYPERVFANVVSFGIKNGLQIESLEDLLCTRLYTYVHTISKEAFKSNYGALLPGFMRSTVHGLLNFRQNITREVGAIESGQTIEYDNNSSFLPLAWPPLIVCARWSIIRKSTPYLARVTAAIYPAGPAPTMRTSTETSSCRNAIFLLTKTIGRSILFFLYTV